MRDFPKLLNGRGLLTDLGYPPPVPAPLPVTDRHPVFQNARPYSEVEERDVAPIAPINNRESAFGASGSTRRLPPSPRVFEKESFDGKLNRRPEERTVRAGATYAVIQIAGVLETKIAKYIRPTRFVNLRYLGPVVCCSSGWPPYRN